MIAGHRKLWTIIGFFPLLVLAACSSGLNTTGSGQSHPTATTLAKPTHNASTSALPTTATQISILSKPTPTSAKPTPTPKPSSPSPFHGNNGSSPAPTPTLNPQSIAQYVLGLINHDRVAMGLPAYSWSNALAGGAHLHNLRMSAYGQLSHQCPGEPGLGTRISNDGLAWRAVGENIGWSTYPDPKQGVLANHQGMMVEKPPDDGHRQNILSSSFNQVGVDVLVDAHHNVWLTEDFAQA